MLFSLGMSYCYLASQMADFANGGVFLGPKIRHFRGLTVLISLSDTIHKWAAIFCKYSKFPKMADFGTKENTAICEIRHLWDYITVVKLHIGTQDFSKVYFFEYFFTLIWQFLVFNLRIIEIWDFKLIANCIFVE